MWRSIPIGAAVLWSCSSAHAQWVSFENQTALRMPTGTGLNDPSLSTNDPEQKSYAWGDLDQDGDIDLVCVRKRPLTFAGGKRAVLFMNEGTAQGHAVNGVLVDRTAQFGSASDAPPWNGMPDQGLLTEVNTTRATLADLDNDGWLDLVTCATLSDNRPNWIGPPRIYMNQGAINGQWQGFRCQPQRIPYLGGDINPKFQPRFMAVAAGDVTGDGFADLYICDMDTGEVGPLENSAADYNNKLLINMGERNPGYFEDSGTTRMSANPGLFSKFSVSCTIVDMNGDGVPDVVKHTFLIPPVQLAIQYNNPQNVGFFPDTSYHVAYTLMPTYVSVGDINLDGRPDMVATNDGADRWLRNTGNGANGLAQFTVATLTSQIATEFDFGGESRIADLNHDGWPEVLIADIDGLSKGCFRRAHLYRNMADGPAVTLLEQNPSVIPLDMLNGTQSIAVFDIDGDGWNVADLLLIINSWGACPAGPPTSCPADLNHDGQVNVLDLLEVIGHWG